eukprot:TRINITY_DN17518_c0_g1_i3.p2 TRINITY_DN17518_c0_g1~~TRINITY_DN17518_c0_g1_i3.p2  ORF type:complete len:129 (+),score=29.88 TRINITY_DN17518_c0_g1_i3:396-782(+)
MMTKDEEKVKQKGTKQPNQPSQSPSADTAEAPPPPIRELPFEDTDTQITGPHAGGSSLDDSPHQQVASHEGPPPHPLIRELPHKDTPIVSDKDDQQVGMKVLDDSSNNQQVASLEARRYLIPAVGYSL